MANITIVIPDDKVTAVVDAFCTQYNYKETITGIDGEPLPNPTTKAQFAKNVIRSFIKEVYISASVKPLEDTRKTTIETAKTEIENVTVD